MEDSSDRDLVAACRDGDHDAYAGLVHKYARRVFAICYGAVGNSDDAEDLAQEALVRGYVQIHRLRHGEQYFPWLRRIAQNLCTDFFRRRKPGEELAADPPETGRVNSALDPGLLDLRQAIARLPEDLRVALVHYYLDGRSTREIARSLGISEAAVHTRLSRARKEMRQLLGGKENGR